jgi:hypothetical protein
MYTEASRLGLRRALVHAEEQGCSARWCAPAEVCVTVGNSELR